MQLNQQTTEQLITGMTKGELAAVIVAVIISIGILIAIMHYVIKLNLRPLCGVPAKLDELTSRMKTHKDIENMIDVKVQAHELNCRVPIQPNRRKRSAAN